MMSDVSRMFFHIFWVTPLGSFRIGTRIRWGSPEKWGLPQIKSRCMGDKNHGKYHERLTIVYYYMTILDITIYILYTYICVYITIYSIYIYIYIVCGTIPYGSIYWILIYWMIFLGTPMTQETSRRDNENHQ